MRSPAARRALPALAATALAIVLAACGDDAPGKPEAPAEATASTSPAPGPPTEGDAGGEVRREQPGGSRADGKPRKGEAEEPSDTAKQDAAAGAERAYTDYVAAINDRDGDALCELLPPNAERALRPPVERGSCGERIGGSIGYEDPRGYPVWTGTTLSGVDRVSIGDDPSTARLTASIVTEFNGREPSIESDIAYLERVGGEWRLAQPTGSLYRAIGRPELPPTVVAPPQG